MQATEVGTTALGNHEDRVKCYADVISPRFEPPKKKRTKSKTDVCARCRESKVRCGAERPCARCIKHNLRDSCVSWRQEEQPSIKLSLPSIKNLTTEATLTRVIPSTISTGLLDEPASAGRPDLPTDIRSEGTAATERALHINLNVDGCPVSSRAHTLSSPRHSASSPPPPPPHLPPLYLVCKRLRLTPELALSHS